MLKHIFVLLAVAALSMSVIAAPPQASSSSSSTTQATTTGARATDETTIVPTETSSTKGPEAAESETLGLAEILSGAASVTLQQERESIERAIKYLQASLSSSIKATRNVIRAGGNFLVIVPKWGYNTILNKEPIHKRPWWERISESSGPNPITVAAITAAAAEAEKLETELAAAAEAAAAAAGNASAAADVSVGGSVEGSAGTAAGGSASIGVSVGGSAAVRPTGSSTRKYDFLYHD
ncbi:hypothetical protein TKK_0007074 [Trichogramma kaykai]|uniref:Uncharacterized protein n=1 Tax=Trichogramma kaykai TaxID=54128 RepID=A0ABD2X9I0_9HYME